MSTPGRKASTRPYLLDRSLRASRLISSAALIGTVMLSPAGILGWYSVLPLLAIYPLITGVTGWDPIYDLLVTRRGDDDDNRLHPLSRIEQAIIGSSLIASAFIVPPAAPTLFAVFSLAGIFPALSAWVGEDLLQNVSSAPLPRTVRAILPRRVVRNVSFSGPDRRQAGKARRAA